MFVRFGGTVSFPGSGYVIFGQAGGFAASIDVSTLDGNNGFALLGIDNLDLAGATLQASAGDINGDGFGDLVIGASGGDPGGDSNAGETYVVFGHRPEAAIAFVGSNLGQTTHGSDFGDTFNGNGGNDRILGYAGTDTIDGGSGNDTMIGGAGDDTYVVEFLLSMLSPT